ncbi:purine-cytosine permease family protein [Zongyangia hominis]|uniref:Cytosine permease n=1 Tax=Zongyangia hominis TaxID=2763677 RepID=A0A926IC45_9FIRM|nr:cytosine permease [Zongyangia hominis]MBC8570720.1 cytosine permease [Zongyangia hominis]
MVETAKKASSSVTASEDMTLDVIPANKRTKWTNAAAVFAGCDLNIPIIFVGATLAQGLKFVTAFVVMLVGLTLAQIYSAINAAVGADTGRPSAQLTRCAFGSVTSRTLISFLLLYMNMGWYGSHVAVAASAGLQAFKVDHTDPQNFWIYAIVMVFIGLIFVIPALKGQRLIAKISKVLVPLVLIVFAYAIFRVFQNLGGFGPGLKALVESEPTSPMSITSAIVLLLGCSACQWLMFSDYSRSNPRIMPDSVLSPFIGNIPVCFCIYGIGIILSATSGTWDIVSIMSNELHMGTLSLLCVLIAQMTTMVVAAYSCGLAVANMFNIKSAKGKMWATIAAAAIGTILALTGILTWLDTFLQSIAILFAPIGIILALDHYLIRSRKWEDHTGVNWIALAAMVIACVAAAFIPIGYSAFTSMFIAGLLYYVGMVIQAKVKPGKYTPEEWKDGKIILDKEQKIFLIGVLGGVFVSFISPFILPSPACDVVAVIGGVITLVGFILAVKSHAILGGRKDAEPAA